MLLAESNSPFVDFWNTTLTPKWIRFRPLLSGNGAIHSDRAWPRIGIRRGQRVLDVGCGFGETCLELADMVGPEGEVLGLDCTRAFLAIAETEREEAGAAHVRYELGDIEEADLPRDHFDVAFSRFGTMFCASPVRALRTMERALAPGGRVHMLAWRTIRDNPCWGEAEAIALSHLPAPSDDADTCGPGPFSMADPETVTRMLEAASLEGATFHRIDAELCIGRTLDEAVEYMMLVGPAGFVIREAKEAADAVLDTIVEEMRARFRRARRADGSVWMPSSTWLISASKAS
ncbi:MAG: class I SAM-dependent methyltransferase [Sandaracinaceae bacterium]